MTVHPICIVLELAADEKMFSGLESFFAGAASRGTSRAISDQRYDCTPAMLTFSAR